MHTRRRFLTTAGGTAACVLTWSAAPASAQSPYPTKPMRWVVPAPAGAPVDSIGRRLADVLSKRLGVPIVIENKPGAASTIGAAEVARAQPDGYTFLFCTADPLVGALAMIKSLPYDPRRDFVFVSKVTSNGPVLVAHPSVKANSLPELIAQLRADQEGMSYGSWGPGTPPTQVMETLAQQAKVRLREVPYRGSTIALQDVLGNQVPMTFTGPNVAAPLIREGKLKALAVVGPRRSPLLPTVATFMESGFKDFVFTNEIWTGLVAPAKLDSAILDKMAQAVQAAVREPAMQTFLSELGFVVVGSTPAQFAQDYAAEVEVVPQLIRNLGIVPQ